MGQRQFRSDDTDRWIYGFGDGKHGSLTVSSNTEYDPTRTGCSGTAGSRTLTLAGAVGFVDGESILIHQSRGTGVGTWELNKILSGGGTTTLTLAHDLMNTYTDSGSSQAQCYLMREYTDVTIESTKNLTVPAWNGDISGILAFFANGTVSIPGSVLGSGGNGSKVQSTGTGGGTGGGFRGGNTVRPTPAQGWQGEGTSGASAQASAANGNGAGGITTAGPYGGAGGGHANNGSQGTEWNGNPIGTPGNSAGSADLVTMLFGGGGAGGTGKADGDVHQGGGGAGGGIIFIAGRVITVTGAMTNKGGNGGNCATGDPNARPTSAGGGGAGGAILLKGHSITLGTSLVTANGGTGGNDESAWSRDGGNGSVGRIHVDYLTSLSGTTSPTLNSRQDLTLINLSGSFLPLI